jgi:hypothetical protein
LGFGEDTLLLLGGSYPYLLLLFPEGLNLGLGLLSSGKGLCDFVFTLLEGAQDRLPGVLPKQEEKQAEYQRAPEK